MRNSIEFTSPKKRRNRIHGIDELYHSLNEFIENLKGLHFGQEDFDFYDRLFKSITDQINEYKKLASGTSPLENVPVKSPHLALKVHMYQRKLDELVIEADFLRETLAEIHDSTKHMPELYQEFKQRLMQFRDDLKIADSVENEILMDSWFQEVGSGD